MTLLKRAAYPTLHTPQQPRLHVQIQKPLSKTGDSGIPHQLSNVMFTNALVRRTTPEQITVNAFDPGLMPGTGLAREYNPVLRFLWNNVLPRIMPLLRMLLFENINSAEESGANLAWVALGKDSAGKSGLYFEGQRAVESSAESKIVEKQDDLWDWTVKEVTGGKEPYLLFK